MKEYDGMEIEQIIVVSGAGFATYNAGPDYPIKRFVDQSVEFPDSVFTRYVGYNYAGKVVKVLDNCPVDITYREESNADENN